MLRTSRSARGLAGPAADRPAAEPPSPFGIDVRSLALLRVGLALLLLADLAGRARSLAAHYTDAGVLPRAVAAERFTGPGSLSLHLLSGGSALQVALFALAALAALALLAGYRTRAATALSWVLLVSLHARNPLVLQSGDVLLRLLLFWSLFLPLGAAFSLDRTMSTGPGAPPRRVRSVAGAAILLQVAFVYWFTALLKLHPIWTHEASAVYYALNIDHFATPVGTWLLGFPALLPWLTHATLLLEAAGPVVALVFYRGPARTAVVLAFAGLHLGFALCLDIGLFAWTSIVSWSVFLPAWFWERAGRLVPRQPGARSAGRTPARLRPRSVAWNTPRVAEVLALVLLVLVFEWNLQGVHERMEMQRPARQLVSALRLGQHWGMFAPHPLIEDGWFVAEGEMEGGRRVDLLRGGSPLSWEKPERVSALYDGQYWRKYMANLWMPEHAAHRSDYLAYLCRDWNARAAPGERPRSVRLVYMLESTPAPGEPLPAPQAVELGERECALEDDGPRPARGAPAP